jgi:hypothetical protein
MSDDLTERAPFAELIADQDFEDQQVLIMEAIAKALLRVAGNVNSWSQIEALAQYIALAMNFAELEDISKLAVLERVFEVISYYHQDIAFSGRTRG